MSLNILIINFVTRPEKWLKNAEYRRLEEY